MRTEISVVVLSWNTREQTLACLRALRRDTPAHTREIVLVDNGSMDGSADAVAAGFPEVILLRNAENRLYAAANNQGAERATGRYLCLLNSDTEVKPGALDRMRDFLANHQEYGAVGPRMLNFDGTVQRACARFPKLIDSAIETFGLQRRWPFQRISEETRMAAFDYLSDVDVEQPPGAVFMMSREEYVRFGGLDPQLSLFFNDVDLCLRLHRANRRIRFLASAEVYHHQGSSTGRLPRVHRLWLTNRLAYYRKNHGRVAAIVVRAVTWLWTLLQALRILLGPRPFAQKRVAWKELGQTVGSAS